MENTKTGSSLFGTGIAVTDSLDPVTEFQKSVEIVNSTSTKEQDKPSKKLSQPEVKYGALVVGSEVMYALNIKAKITTSTNMFGGFGSSLLADTTSDSTTVERQESINTVLLAVVNPKTNEVSYVEVTEDSPIFPWLIGDKSAKFEIPTYLPDNLRSIVGKSMTEFKGILNSFYPLNHETSALVSSDIVLSNSIKEFTEAALQLKDAIVAAKKLGGNIGLDGFIERYAFNNHVLLAGPRGVKFLHDTIAA